MKGQFFVIATVIMIYTLMTMIQYVYDFSDINLVQLKKMTEIYYIQYIKDTLNKTVAGSRTSLDCDKLKADIITTENFLKNEMISRGINLTINHNIDCSSLDAYFYFSLKTSEFYSETNFPHFDGDMWLKFDEGSGTIAHDFSQYHNDGTLGDGTCTPGTGSCPTWVDGKFGKALSFDGSTEYANVTNSSSLCINSQITITAWIRPLDQSSYRTIVQRRWTETTGTFWFGLDPANILFALVTDAGNNVYDYYNTGALTLGNWYFVAATYNGTTMFVYFNGQQGNAYAQSGNFSGFGDYIIGKHSSSLFNGTIDELRIYNRALTPTEIQNIMNNK